MRESALFGTMFGLGAGAVLVGVTVSRLVVGQASDNPAAEPPAFTVETAPPAAVEPPPPAAVIAPAVAPPVAPRAEIALSGQHRPLPRKHRRATVAEKSAPTSTSVVKEISPTASIAKREVPSPALPPPAPVVEKTAPPAEVAEREAPAAAPPRAQVDDAPLARDAPIAIVRGGVARPGSPAPGAHIIQVEPRDR
jgi:hypothetical protein